MGVSVCIPVLLFLIAPQDHVLMLLFYTIITYHALISCSIIIKKRRFYPFFKQKTDLVEKKNETKKLEEEE